MILQSYTDGRRKNVFVPNDTVSGIACTHTNKYILCSCYYSVVHKVWKTLKSLLKYFTDNKNRCTKS